MRACHKANPVRRAECEPDPGFPSQVSPQTTDNVDDAVSKVQLMLDSIQIALEQKLKVFAVSCYFCENRL